MAINDAELKSRLLAHNYVVPPITDTTRSVLTKKLLQLDASTKKVRAGHLLEYSSAEEDSPRPSEIPKRRISSSSSASRNNSRNLISAKRSVDVDDYEESDDDVGVCHFGVQTSLDSTESSPPSSSSSSLRFRSQQPHFISSTPSPRSTASYTTSSSPLSSQTLRKQIAKSKELGSLGEALNSLPKSGSQIQPHVVSSLASSSSGFRWNSHLISSLIIGSAGIFFLFLALSYFSLRPSGEISHRILLCGREVIEADDEDIEKNKEGTLNSNCVSPEDLTSLSRLYKDTLSFLQSRDCHSETLPAVTLEELRSLLTEEEDESRLGVFYDLLAENPSWGIGVDDGKLFISSSFTDWPCWMTLKLHYSFSTLQNVILYGVYGVGALLCFYALYLFRLRRSEKRQQENVLVFEIVEQVLGFLANHQEPVAINHLRDQLFPPSERLRSKALWAKVVAYIRDSESRVREDIRTIYGEESRVWLWIPEFRSTASSAYWQGSAFHSLNKTVAAPLIAPTSCLKVRHLYDPNVSDGSFVKEEVLRRVSSPILHIALDKSNPEGCVYIKAASPCAAGSVFKALHGQWYRGNLVTVKYLREERYNERYPESKHLTTPLTLTR